VAVHAANTTDKKEGLRKPLKMCVTSAPEDHIGLVWTPKVRESLIRVPAPKSIWQWLLERLYQLASRDFDSWPRAVNDRDFDKLRSTIRRAKRAPGKRCLRMYKQLDRAQFFATD